MGEPANNFETSFLRIQEIVKSLEQGKRPLDESLKLFEEGMKLSEFCQKELSEAELKIKQFVEIDAQGQMHFKPIA